MNKITNFIKGLFKSRSLRYGSNSIILVAVVVAIAVLLNVIVNMSTFKWDLTSNKLYSLSDNSKKILTGLNKKVTIYGLFDDGTLGSGNDYKEVTELLNNYTKYSNITVKYTDPDKNPGLIKQLDPDNVNKLQKNDFVVKSGNKMRVLSYSDLFQTQFDQQSFQQYKVGSNAEQAISGAIKYVTADVTPTVYFTQGHDERKVDDEYKTVKEYLGRNNYDVKTVNLATTDKVPKDAQIVIVASPKRDLTTDEMNRLQDYLNNGGNAILLFDPSETNTSFDNFQKLLQPYNVAVDYDKVKENDGQRHVPNNAYDILPDVQNNDINKLLDPASFAMIMPESRSLSILKNSKQYITVTSLMKSSDKAVGEQIDKSKGADLPGPLDLAVAVENKGGLNPSKLLVMGNGLFMTDTAISQYQQLSVNGLYFFLNSMNWMQNKQDDNLIAPKSYSNQSLKITQTQASATAVVVVILFPLLILGAGTFVWMRRRHL